MERIYREKRILYFKTFTYFRQVYATVEMEGKHTKGMVLVDWNPEHRVTGGEMKPNLIIVDAIDENMYREVFVQSTSS